MLREQDTFVDLRSFYKGDNFWEFMFDFLHTYQILKREIL